MPKRNINDPLMKTCEKHCSSLTSLRHYWLHQQNLSSEKKTLDLRITSLCLGFDQVGVNGRHSLKKYLFTEQCIHISTMCSSAFAERENLGIRIIWILWYMMQLRNWLRRKHQLVCKTGCCLCLCCSALEKRGYACSLCITVCFRDKKTDRN